MNHLKEIKRIKRYKKKKRYTNAEKGYLYELFMKYIFLFLLLSRKMSLYESENVLLSIKNKYLILKKTQYLYTMNQNIIPLIVMINTGFTNA